MNGEEKKIYDRALVKYSMIVRCGGNSIEEIKECINIFEEFEDYEKYYLFIKLILIFI